MEKAIREEMRALRAELSAELDRRMGDAGKRLADFDKRLTNERISDLNRMVAASFVGIVATLVATILLKFLP